MLCSSSRSCARRTAASVLHLMVAATIVACGLRGADAFATAPMRLQRAKLTARSRFPAERNLGLSMRKLQNDMFTEEERGMYQEGIKKVLQANKNLHSHFEIVREQEFFRYYAVDLLSSCTYFPTVSTLPQRSPPFYTPHTLHPPTCQYNSPPNQSGVSASADLLHHPLVLAFSSLQHGLQPVTDSVAPGLPCFLVVTFFSPCAPPWPGPVIVAQVEFPCEMERCDVDSAEDVRDDMRERDQNEHDFRLDGWVRWDMPGERDWPLTTLQFLQFCCPLPDYFQTPISASSRIFRGWDAGVCFGYSPQLG